MPLDGRIQDYAPAEVEPDVFSLDGLIAWLEKQPRNEEYCYENNGHCLLARYFVAMGYQRPNVGSSFVYYGAPLNRQSFGLPLEFNEIAVRHPRTFGEALIRVRDFHARIKD